MQMQVCSSQDIFWRLVTQPEAKYDAGSLNAACDVAFAAASVYFKRLGEEKERLATLERDMLRDQLAHELANSQKAQKRRRPGGS
jgi:anti-sigma factor ChrR (cupin superfamily)